MIVRSWQDVDPDVLWSLYVREQQHWHDTLFWDTGSHWTEIERARQTWGLPGLLACGDSGDPEGWCFYLRDAGVVQIGAIVAETPPATVALLNEVLKSRDESEAISCFMPERAPGLVPALEARGFDLEPHLYLSVDIARGPHGRTEPAPAGPGREPGAPIVTAVRPHFTETDIRAAADLLRAAYPADAGRYFAAHGLRDEWIQYVRNLIEQPGCGEFQPMLSRMATMTSGIAGLILMTKIDARTAHVAQLAVSASARGRGLARHLLDEAMAAAAAAGLERVTLLVAASNLAALSLYQSRGFAPRATFIAAHKSGSIS